MLPGEAPLPAAVDDLQLSNLDYSLEMSSPRENNFRRP